VVLHQLRDPRLFEELQATAREEHLLERIDHYVARSRIGMRQQSFANVQSRDSVAEADLHRLRRFLPYNPPSQCLAFGGAHRERKKVVARAVGTCHGGAGADQLLDGDAYPPHG
jgi:hypothetical protein